MITYASYCGMQEVAMYVQGSAHARVLLFSKGPKQSTTFFFILLLLFYCSSPTEEANEQTKHSHIVCSDTFWLDVHHSHRSPKTLELTPLNLRSVHSWISFLKVKTNVFKPCFKETFCFSIIFIVKLFIN